jgi:hypothetical protein
MSYRTKLQKSITLPSGSKVNIRKLNAFNEPFLNKRQSETDEDAGNRVAKFILLNCIGPIVTDGESLTVVEKKESECSKNELGLTELDNVDATFIVNQVIDFSGMSKAGQEARKTFLEAQPENGGERASAGEAVSGTPSDGAPATAAG